VVSIDLKAIMIVWPETLVRWHQAGRVVAAQQLDIRGDFSIA
jgi:hypothetical protein